MTTCGARHFPEYRRHGVLTSILRRLYWTRRFGLAAAGVRAVTRVLFGCEIPVMLIPAGVVFMHNGFGIAIHPNVEFTGPALICPGSMLGGQFGEQPHRAPCIGSHVIIGAGAKVLGDVRIGDYCVIGANSVVTSDMPARHQAVGNPARVTALDPNRLHAIWGHPPLA